MKNKSFALKRLDKGLVQSYSRQANGNERFVGFDSFDDLPNMASGGAVASRSTEPYVLSIVNAGAGVETAIIFGRNRFVGALNFGSGAGITITMGVAGVPYEQLLQQSASEPFEVIKLRLSSTSVPQLDISMTYVKTDSNGQEARTPITVSSYLSPDQFLGTLRDVDYRMQVDGNTHIEYPIINAVTVTMSVYISAKVNIAKPLIAKGAITEYSSARVRSFKS